MNNTKLAFILSTIAGLTTLLGSIIILFAKKNPRKILIISLSFAFGVMLSISVLDLIPEAFIYTTSTYKLFPSLLIILIGLNIGILISKYIENIVPNNNEIYKIGIISMLAIIIHNIPEGIATFLTTDINIKLGIKMSLAIALHNIPEGIIISMPLYYATKNIKKALIYTFISGISELFGALIAYFFLKPFINNMIMGLLFSIIAGIMIYISVFELFPTAKKYNKSTCYKISIITIILVLLITYIFK